jgi:predicted transcriptional regulator
MHAALAALGGVDASAAAAVEKMGPAQIRKSITHEALISFEDGKPYKTLKRHLTGLGLTPETYRAKWGLPGDYPLVAASYSERRSALARSIGLGYRRRDAAPKAAAPSETLAEKPKRARRSRKANKSADA